MTYASAEGATYPTLRLGANFGRVRYVAPELWKMTWPNNSPQRTRAAPTMPQPSYSVR
jgi:hypothetical protein